MCFVETKKWVSKRHLIDCFYDLNATIEGNVWAAIRLETVEWSYSMHITGYITSRKFVIYNMYICQVSMNRHVFYLYVLHYTRQPPPVQRSVNTRIRAIDLSLNLACEQHIRASLLHQLFVCKSMQSTAHMCSQHKRRSSVSCVFFVAVTFSNCCQVRTYACFLVVQRCRTCETNFHVEITSLRAVMVRQYVCLSTSTAE